MRVDILPQKNYRSHHSYFNPILIRDFPNNLKKASNNFDTITLNINQKFSVYNRC